MKIKNIMKGQSYIVKILVTGFDPFGREKINPAIEAVKRLPDEISGAELKKLEIPTVFDKCAEIVHDAIEDFKPDYVLNVGQAGGRSSITVERVAINLDDGRVADNAGFKPTDRIIHEDGETAYFTQLPIKAIVRAIRKNGLPANISNSAGTYVCNHIMYQVQYMRDKEFPNIRAGFIHIPYLPEQVVNRPNTPSMSLENVVKGLTIAIETIIELDGKSDLKSI